MKGSRTLRRPASAHVRAREGQAPHAVLRCTALYSAGENGLQVIQPDLRIHQFSRLLTRNTCHCLSPVLLVSVLPNSSTTRGLRILFAASSWCWEIQSIRKET